MIGYIFAAAAALFFIARCVRLSAGWPEGVGLFVGLFIFWFLVGPPLHPNGGWRPATVNDVCLAAAIAFIFYFPALLIDAAFHGPQKRAFRRANSPEPYDPQKFREHCEKVFQRRS